ncbi:MAG: TA system VapC family ribonuclease toxin [Burkholderiales bacterium]
MPIRSPTGSARAGEPPARAYLRAGDLPDLNVWIALSVDNHVHHARARRYWREEGAQAPAIHFCRHTMLGFLRLLTQPKLMGAAACTPSQAAAHYAALRALPEVALAAEPSGCEAAFLGYARAPGFSARLWSDAYLAAFASCAHLRLVTFDADFARFEGLERLRLD